MIFGAHALLYSKQPEKTRLALKKILGTRAVDAGGGWTILALPPGEIGVHPTGGRAKVELYLMCTYLDDSIARLKKKGIRTQGAIREASWGRSCALALPGGASLGLYQPLHRTAVARPARRKRRRA